MTRNSNRIETAQRAGQVYGLPDLGEHGETGRVHVHATPEQKVVGQVVRCYQSWPAPIMPGEMGSDRPNQAES
jgi:hypothetical protein